MAYYLGLDAGGTKTICALARDGAILARVPGGSIKRMHVSHEEASRHLDKILQEISEQSGVSLASIDCTCVGLSGSSVPLCADWVREALKVRVGGKISICGDEMIALDAAFRGGPGVLAIAGTGTNIVARTNGGQILHVGGWGPVVADEGAGAWIGRRAVRAVFDSFDRGETTALWEVLQREWNLSDIWDLTDWANREPAPHFAKLVPEVVACAQRGDSYAAGVLRQAGEHLGSYVCLALRRWQAVEGKPLDAPAVAYTGSILSHISAVREKTCTAILEEFPAARIQPEPVDPVLGAIWQARQTCEGRLETAESGPVANRK
jgi:N-acetylglucosamine kinase-like BadF-type ATPase